MLNIFTTKSDKTQADTIIDFLSNRQNATTADINNLKINGKRIANVSLAVFRARKKLKQIWKTIASKQFYERNNKEIVSSYAVYWIE